LALAHLERRLGREDDWLRQQTLRALQAAGLSELSDREQFEDR
jgi:hypothetical protein